ncbi:hypothetical protein ACIQAC_39220 [Streptomyces sp. NPDC088387]|uniref:hypothetical protein n=1 Tax=Streptomyces sp. NPDC088387 TaxID=3365859 RepID=UPI003811DE69
MNKYEGMWMAEGVGIMAARGVRMDPDVIWQSLTKVCRITNLLPSKADHELLERAISAIRGDWLPAGLGGNQLDAHTRRSPARQSFSAPELLAAIGDVVGQIEGARGVSCANTEPSHTLNVHNDGDFYRARQQDCTYRDFSPGAQRHRLPPASHAA